NLNKEGFRSHRQNKVRPEVVAESSERRNEIDDFRRRRISKIRVAGCRDYRATFKIDIDPIESILFDDTGHRVDKVLLVRFSIELCWSMRPAGGQQCFLSPGVEDRDIRLDFSGRCTVIWYELYG